ARGSFTARSGRLSTWCVRKLTKITSDARRGGSTQPLSNRAHAGVAAARAGFGDAPVAIQRQVSVCGIPRQYVPAGTWALGDTLEQLQIGAQLLEFVRDAQEPAPDLTVSLDRIFDLRCIGCCLSHHQGPQRYSRRWRDGHDLRFGLRRRRPDGTDFR